jgi:hypothetical protein
VNALQVTIVVAWIAISVLAFVFVLIFGPPSRYVDKTMAWHLAFTTALAGLEPIGLLLAGVSLVPAAIIYVGTIAVMVWRLVLLLRERARPHPPNG